MAMIAGVNAALQAGYAGARTDAPRFVLDRAEAYLDSMDEGDPAAFRWSDSG